MNINTLGRKKKKEKKKHCFEIYCKINISETHFIVVVIDGFSGTSFVVSNAPGQIGMDRFVSVHIYKAYGISRQYLFFSPPLL